jgi:hypothetical protein
MAIPLGEATEVGLQYATGLVNLGSLLGPLAVGHP